MRKKSTFLAAMSILLFVAFLFMHYDSYSLFGTTDVEWRPSLETEVIGISSKGSITIAVYGGDNPWNDGVATFAIRRIKDDLDLSERARTIARENGVYLLGFGFWSKEVRGSRIIAGAIIPYWFFELLLAILPAHWLKRWLHMHRKGLCIACGYDIRASEGACPECGATIKTDDHQ